jgi:hypothetical protein
MKDSISYWFRGGIMQGNISLGDFIKQVREELEDARDESGNAFYRLKNVELEVAFSLETKGGAKAELVVVEMGGQASATQLHKVKLQLTPLIKQKRPKEGEEIWLDTPYVDPGDVGLPKYIPPDYVTPDYLTKDVVDKTKVSTKTQHTALKIRSNIKLYPIGSRGGMGGFVGGGGGIDGLGP